MAFLLSLKCQSTELNCRSVDNTIPKLAEELGVSVEELMQIKGQAAEPDSKGEAQKMINLILSVIPLAMGVAVVVLSLLEQLDIKSGMSMLGIGMACIGIRMLQTNKNTE